MHGREPTASPYCTSDFVTTEAQCDRYFVLTLSGEPRPCGWRPLQGPNGDYLSLTEAATTSTQTSTWGCVRLDECKSYTDHLAWLAAKDGRPLPYPSPTPPPPPPYPPAPSPRPDDEYEEEEEEEEEPGGGGAGAVAMQEDVVSDADGGSQLTLDKAAPVKAKEPIKEPTEEPAAEMSAVGITLVTASPASSVHTRGTGGGGGTLLVGLPSSSVHEPHDLVVANLKADSAQRASVLMGLAMLAGGVALVAAACELMMRACGKHQAHLLPTTDDVAED